MLASLPVTAPLVPGVALLLTSLLPIVVQLYRYVRIYDAVQQQQTKWFVLGLSVVFFLVLIQGILQAVVPGSSAANSWYQLFNGGGRPPAEHPQGMSLHIGLPHRSSTIWHHAVFGVVGRVGSLPGPFNMLPSGCYADKIN